MRPRPRRARSETGPSLPLSAAARPSRARWRPALALTVCVAAGLTAACGGDRDAPPATSPGGAGAGEPDTTGDGSVSRFFDALASNFSSLDDEIEALESRLEAAGATASREWATLLEAAQRRREDLEERMRELQDATGPEVERLQREVREAWQAAEAAVRSAVDAAGGGR